MKFSEFVDKLEEALTIVVSNSQNGLNYLTRSDGETGDGKYYVSEYRIYDDFTSVMGDEAIYAGHKMYSIFIFKNENEMRVIFKKFRYNRVRTLMNEVLLSKNEEKDQMWYKRILKIIEEEISNA